MVCVIVQCKGQVSVRFNQITVKFITVFEADHILFMFTNWNALDFSEIREFITSGYVLSLTK